MYAVITENDESQWSDDTGVLYHFPKRYASILPPGAQIIYYKGRMKDERFAASRLSPQPHYFGQATIGKTYADPGSDKGDLFATIDDYERFPSALDFKSGGAYLEVIPAGRESNYWRDGVRSIDVETYQKMLKLAGVKVGAQAPPPAAPEPTDSSIDFESGSEGSPTLRYVVTYERDPKYRRQALAIHGLTCKACDENMAERYGAYAHGLIHVHHVVPVSTYDAPCKIDPGTDLVPVCPNCHAVIHRKKARTLTIAEVRAMLGKPI
jgi:predicted HNH restriction endonuclease